jgi:hypothetical protein
MTLAKKQVAVMAVLIALLGMLLGGTLLAQNYWMSVYDSGYDNGQAIAEGNPSTHEHSPVAYALAVYGTLRPNSDGINDALLCVAKTQAGDFTARSRGGKNGTIYTVKDSTFGGGGNCNNLHANINWHQAGKNPWGSADTNWSAISDHNAGN